MDVVGHHPQTLEGLGIRATHESGTRQSELVFREPDTQLDVLDARCAKRRAYGSSRCPISPPCSASSRPRSTSLSYIPQVRKALPRAFDRRPLAEDAAGAACWPFAVDRLWGGDWRCRSSSLRTQSAPRSSALFSAARFATSTSPEAHLFKLQQAYVPPAASVITWSSTCSRPACERERLNRDEKRSSRPSSKAVTTVSCT